MNIQTTTPIELKLTADELNSAIASEVAKAFSKDTHLIETLVKGLLSQKKDVYSRTTMFEDVVKTTLWLVIEKEIEKQALERFPAVQEVIRQEFGARFADDEYLKEQFSQAFSSALSSSRFYFVSND